MRGLFLSLILITSTAIAQTDEEINNNAVNLMDEGRYKEAIPFFSKLIQGNPENTLYRYNRAIALSNLGRVKEALADYTILYATIPDESEYAFQIGNSYEALDSIPQADFFFSEAIRLDNTNYLYFFKRGTLYLKQFEWTKARQDFDASLALNPYHDNSLHNRGIALYKLGFKELACTDWCQAIALGNTHSISHLEKNCKKRLEPCQPKNEDN
ncbi:MAG: tetratricopeptide repeat protein [Cyclobacteriaceae bacterium]|nr:tetratricopeptide repeat protein [Cyclobacteriaceae bacterium]